jgi:hypothetical protein
VWSVGGGATTLTDVTLAHNQAGDGGAVFLDDAAVLTYTGGAVTDNAAGRNGGGINTESGGAMVDVAQVLFAGNDAFNSNGGALRMVNASSTAPAVLTVTNSVFLSNTAAAGGALWVETPTVAVLEHITAVDNRAKANGTFLYIGATTGAELHDSIVAYGRILVADNLPTGSAVYGALTAGTLYTQTYSTFFANEGDLEFNLTYPKALQPDPAAGNDDLDPLLSGVVDTEDWANNDLTLPLGSPAIDSADPAGAPDPDLSLPDRGAFGGPLGEWTWIP